MEVRVIRPVPVSLSEVLDPADQAVGKILKLSDGLAVSLLNDGFVEAVRTEPVKTAERRGRRPKES